MTRLDFQQTRSRCSHWIRRHLHTSGTTKIRLSARIIWGRDCGGASSPAAIWKTGLLLASSLTGQKRTLDMGDLQAVEPGF